MRLVDSWLLLLSSLTLSQARPTHLPDSMIVSSLHYEWQGLGDAMVEVTCKMQGPKTSFTVWHQFCLPKDLEDLAEQTAGTNKAYATEKHTVKDNPLCNTSHCEEAVFLTSVYYGRLPKKHVECYVVCCGYSPAILEPTQAQAKSDNANMSNPSIYMSNMTSKDFLRNDFVWSNKKPTTMDNDTVYYGECLGIYAQDTVESQSNRPVILKVFIYVMVGFIVFALVSAAICLLMSDDRSNKDKRRQFRLWVERKKQHASMHSSTLESLASRRRSVSMNSIPFSLKSVSSADSVRTVKSALSVKSNKSGVTFIIERPVGKQQMSDLSFKAIFSPTSSNSVGSWV